MSERVPHDPTEALDKRVLDLLEDWRDKKSWDDGFLGLIGRFVPWFDAERIEYLFSESVAVRLHGGDPRRHDASLMMTPAAWVRARERQDGRFMTSDYGNRGSLTVPHLGYASTVTFRDSLEAVGVTIHGVRVASLPFLITNLMFRMGDWERRSVISLIRANDLDEAFRFSLPAHRRATFRDLLAEARKAPK